MSKYLLVVARYLTAYELWAAPHSRLTQELTSKRASIMNPRPLLNMQLLIGAFLGLFLLGLVETAQAQIYRPPAGPTLPRQLNYFRRDVGLLDQYNTFVQPQRQLEAQLSQMQQQQAAAFRSTQRQLEQLNEVRPSQAAATGVGATFQNYSHYYRTPSSGAPRR